YFEGAARKEVGTANAAVLYVADTTGSSGNDISLEYVTPGVAGLTSGAGDGAVTVTADAAGASGNDIEVEYVQSAGLASLSVGVAEASGTTTITVTLATDAGGNLISDDNTATLVAAAINNNIDASALVTAEAGGDGSGAVTAAASASLSGGSDADAELTVSVTGDAITVTLGKASGQVVSNAQEVAQAINDHATAGNMVTAYASGDGSGVVSATAAVDLESGDDTSLMSQQLNGVATATKGSGSEAVLFAADRAGLEGNGIEIVYVDPGAEGSLSVSVSGDTITVTLASDGTDVTSSAKDVADAINSDSQAAAKITAYAGGTGTISTTGTVTLSGGDTNPLTSVIRAEAGGNGSGLVEARDPIVLNGGKEPDDFSTTTTVYDSLGNPVDLTIDFIFDPVTSYSADKGIVEKISQWTWIARSSEGVANAHGTLRFDSTGQLDRINSKWDTGVMTDPPNPQYTLRDDGNPTIGITDLSSGASDISMVWDLTNSTLITGFSADSEIRSQTQDGYSPGTLREISVDGDGLVWGSFSNGQSQALYQVGLAVFSNYNGLSSQGSNVFSETVESGVGLFGVASTGGRGRISPGSLELSNVDLAEEFVRMITIQRAYQANTKVITTSSDILQELVNMKR
ncbi:MAG: flagellar hook-basal body complex protein, partial [Deltaproteobacteria bacterium]|nr:flagellar hook-basal body complex protein [Deltaproteobacteria bacterium]